MWANFDKYKTIKDVAEEIKIPYITIKNNWLPKSRKFSDKIRQQIACNTLTEKASMYLLKFPVSVQDKLGTKIADKGLTQNQAIKFIKNYDVNPNADLDDLANDAKGIKKIEVSVDQIPKEVLQKINDEKEQFAKIQRIKTPRKKPSKPITKAEV